MKTRQAIALAAVLLSLAACHWMPVTGRQISPAAGYVPQTAPVPSQLHTMVVRAR